jgi:hypothetical protein
MLLAGAILLAAIACVVLLYVFSFRSDPQPVAPAAAVPPHEPLFQSKPEHARVTSGEVELVRPKSGGVEGMEIRYGCEGIIRAVRVGAMNAEHKELLLTMDELQWRQLPNAQKQEVVAAARSTWAAKMCANGPDIAYVVVKTERGEIVGRASPSSVTIS